MQVCDFQGSRTIGKPAGWDEALDGPCLEIFIHDAVDTLTGLPVMYSVFKLSHDEICALAAGGVLRLGIVGMRAHPVFNLGVLSPEVVADAGVVPRGELGGVIEMENPPGG